MVAWVRRTKSNKAPRAAALFVILMGALAASCGRTAAPTDVCLAPEAAGGPFENCLNHRAFEARRVVASLGDVAHGVLGECSTEAAVREPWDDDGVDRTLIHGLAHGDVAIEDALLKQGTESANKAAESAAFAATLRFRVCASGIAPADHVAPPKS